MGNSNTPGVLVTGTDTGVGKTFVSCCLAAILQEKGYRVGVSKPFESGLDDFGENRTDAMLLKLFSDSPDSLDLVNPVQYRRPLAPAVAAWEEGEANLTGVLQAISEIRSRSDFMIVEGAGGLLVPLSEEFFVLDLAKELNLPVLLVAANRLGVINHTLLTLHALESEGVQVAGVILNELPGPPAESKTTNHVFLEKSMNAPLLGTLPPIVGEWNPKMAAAFFDNHINIDALLSMRG